MIVTRVERHQINKYHALWKYCDDYCFRSKNLYNYANYHIRQEFIKNNKWLRYGEVNDLLKQSESYQSLMAQCAQQTLRLLDKNWVSFFKAIKQYTKNPELFTGRPKLPKYKDKNGRSIVVFTNQNCKLKKGHIKFPKCFNQYLLKTKVDNIQQVRIIPSGSIYWIEVVYKIDIQEQKENDKNIIGIDLGIDNFATISNNIGTQPIIINGKTVKSMNQFYNKQLALWKSDLKKRHCKDWSNKLERLTIKRNNKINDFLHKSSKTILDWCLENNIDTIVVGKNDGWKQESKMSKKVNQNFVQIPHAKFIEKLVYKAENVGINVVLTEEKYTSGTSFLDSELPVKENYNKSRRIKRGLFKSNNGKLINADLNGAYQIIMKVFPNAFSDGIEGVGLHPVRVNVA